MVVVGAAARRDVDDAAAGPPVLRFEGVGDNRELLHAVDNRRIAGLQVADVVLRQNDGRAVDRDFVGGIPSAADPRGGTATARHDTRDERCQPVNAAAVQRQILNRPAANNGGDTGSFGRQLGGLGTDLDRCGDIADLQINGQGNRLVDVDGNAILDISLKARLFHGEAVIPRQNETLVEAPFRIGSQVLMNSGRFVFNNDFGAGNGRPGGIVHPAIQDTGCGLAKKTGGDE